MTLHMDRVLAGQKGGKRTSAKKRAAVVKNLVAARAARWTKRSS